MTILKLVGEDLYHSLKATQLKAALKHMAGVKPNRTILEDIGKDGIEIRFHEGYSKKNLESWFRRTYEVWTYRLKRGVNLVKDFLSSVPIRTRYAWRVLNEPNLANTAFSQRIAIAYGLWKGVNPKTLGRLKRTISETPYLQDPVIKHKFFTTSIEFGYEAACLGKKPSLQQDLLNHFKGNPEGFKDFLRNLDTNFKKNPLGDQIKKLLDQN